MRASRGLELSRTGGSTRGWLFQDGHDLRALTPNSSRLVATSFNGVRDRGTYVDLAKTSSADARHADGRAV